jgi:virulence-associated protein VagC
VKIKFDDKQFLKEMNNIMNYSTGFLEGVQRGKYGMLNNVGASVSQLLGEFVDSNARSNPQMLQHMYEWYHSGQRSERLFDIHFMLMRNGVAFDYSFRQSQSIKVGSKVAFFDKAEIMEEGRKIVIKPRNKDFLSFDVDGEQVYTSKPVEVATPGGTYATGSFDKTVESFFSTYLTQTFLEVSGLRDYISNPISYKRSLNSGKINGRSVGIDAGYRWMVMAGVGASE